MRYCTKEWYETMQKTDLHLLLKTEKRAEAFSEEYYQNLYAKKEAEFLKMKEETSKVKFEDICSEDEFFSHEEYEEARKEFEEGIEEFDPEKLRKSFREGHNYNIELLKEALPEDILKKVADIRVLALDFCTAEVKKLIAKFCKENDKEVNRTFRMLAKAEQEEFGDNLPEFTNESLHDCEITALEKDGSDIILRFDNSDGYADCTAVVFKNAEIIEQDDEIIGAWWLYDEIYKTDNGFEIHALLSGDELIYFTVKCEKTEFLR